MQAIILRFKFNWTNHSAYRNLGKKNGNLWVATKKSVWDTNRIQCASVFSIVSQKGDDDERPTNSTQCDKTETVSFEGMKLRLHIFHSQGAFNLIR